MAKVYQEFSPSPRLAQHIECFWSLEATANTQQLVVPDGCMDILLRFDKDIYAFEVIGSMTKPERAEIRSGHRYLGVRFKPGRLCQVVPIDCSKIVDSAEPLQNKPQLNFAAVSAGINRDCSNEETIERLERALAIHSAPPAGQRAIDAMVARDGNISSAELADIAGLSERQFRRQCILLTGLSPKVLARVLRFRKAHQKLQLNPSMRLTDIALDCGYADQAHFSHDFTRFAGCPPALYAKWKS